MRIEWSSKSQLFSRTYCLMRRRIDLQPTIQKNEPFGAFPLLTGRCKMKNHYENHKIHLSFPADFDGPCLFHAPSRSARTSIRRCCIIRLFCWRQNHVRRGQDYFGRKKGRNKNSRNDSAKSLPAMTINSNWCGRRRTHKVPCDWGIDLSRRPDHVASPFGPRQGGRPGGTVARNVGFAAWQSG